jgi:gamma-D-glutamyl-L-lysine dipeptidyl-peptidase
MTLATPAAPPGARRRLAMRAIAVGVAPVYGEPDGGAEQVTQALLGARAQVMETLESGWARVRLADYVGWVERAHLTSPASPARPRERVAVITTPRAPLYARATGLATHGEVYATTALPFADDPDEVDSPRARMALPGGRSGWLERGTFVARPADTPFPPQGVAAALRLAHALLDTPYLWGGVTALGIDCSGLTQLACQAAGAIIPRDADQQYAALPYVVDRASVRAGDLLYFASRGHITHTGLALDNMTLLHANGYTRSVAITSLDPAHDAYSADLAGWYAGARRPFPDAPQAEAAR